MTIDLAATIEAAAADMTVAVAVAVDTATVEAVDEETVAMAATATETEATRLRESGRFFSKERTPSPCHLFLPISSEMLYAFIGSDFRPHDCLLDNARTFFGKANRSS